MFYGLFVHTGSEGSKVSQSVVDAKYKQCVDALIIPV